MLFFNKFQTARNYSFIIDAIKKIPVLIICSILLSSCTHSGKSKQDNNDWALLPFVKLDSVNPIFLPKDETQFECPILQKNINWEQKDVFNPTAIVKNDTVYMLYRAEDTVGTHLGTSRIGIAESTDGINFIRHKKPVLYPDNDDYKIYEYDGGCEDPRIVEDENGVYYMTYTAYDGELARLFIASSTDLFHWTKHGSVFKKTEKGKYVEMWSKSGSIVCRKENDKFIATKINGQYWMYWGDSQMYLAHSENLIDWTPVKLSASNTISDTQKEGRDFRRTGGKETFLPVLETRKGKFDSGLVEPGPHAILTKKGILLIYNSRNDKNMGDANLADRNYSAGQALFDAKHPEKLLKRLDNYFFTPDKDYEITGQVNNVCFLEGLVFYHKKYFLYYGTADSKIAVATCSSAIK